MQQHAATFFAQAEDAAGADLPQFVKDEFDAFLECGILAHGFLRLRCGACGHDKLLAFSCKRRGFCPSCGARRMSQTAAHLVDHGHPWLQYGQLHATNSSWVSGQSPQTGVLAAKARYRQSDAPCRLEPDTSAPDAAFALTFPDAQWAVTPGQSAVLYDGEVCLGGGVIDVAQAVSA